MKLLYEVRLVNDGRAIQPVCFGDLFYTTKKGPCPCWTPETDVEALNAELELIL